MSDSLLQTKLYIPPLRPSLVLRTRLLEQLTHNKHSKLTLISAPAGFGKTTLVVAWLAEGQEGERAACWLSLDENDNGLARFFTYLIAAIRTVAPQFGNSLLASLQSAQPPNETAVTQTLLNQLATLNQPLVLVLDDYHLITDTAVHNALTTLIEYLPPHIHIIITSREDPPLPLPRWRVRGQLTEIRADDLRFNTAEATDFFQQTMGLSLGQQAITSLESRTEGWAAGLQLAALSLHGQSDPTEQVASLSGSDRHIADYLLSEVLHQQPPEIQQFLLQTAVLDRLCAPLCHALLANQSLLSTLHSQDVLERLEATNLFLIPLDNQRRWYRYHHLFADLLRGRLQRDVGETAVGELHKRAAQWYESQNLHEEAIRHAFEAEDLEYAGRLVAETAVDSLWQQGGAALARQWAKALPASIIQAHPHIAILASTAHLIIGDIQPAARYLDMAANQPSVEAEWHLLEAILLRNQGQVPQALELAQHALENLASDQHNLRTFAYLQLVSNFLQMAELDEAEQVIHMIRRHFDQIDVGSRLHVLRMHGLIATNRANFYQAAAIYGEGLQLPDAERQPMIGTLYNGLGFLRFQQHEMDQAASYYEQAKIWADRTGITDILFDAYLGEADLACWRGEPQIALDIMARFRKFAQQSNLPLIVEMSELYNVLYHLKAGRLETAVQWATNSGLTVDDKPSFQLYGHYKLFIATHIRHSEQSGDTRQLPALAQLAERLLTMFQQRNYIFDALVLLTWMTVLYELAGNREKAVDSLQTAVAYAQPSNIIYPFVARGRILQTVLSQLQPTPFIQRLVHIFNATSQTPSVPHPSQLLELLTGREREVLACLAAGLSNKAIEEKLYISKNTVRTHLKNLYGKLGVNGRTQAVARARELELL
ncbi:LuxR C-terminal-related transcriptional regulator [Candidatus Leptofilum sp.]|uniref:LuxR C-terminal-related transcriptional regulator n=1 Tax=Candidatus Leptofilum sp. TaxID=3241576 RepID=UPI003B5922E6